MSDLSCNFDDGTLCLWKQSKTDDFDWTVARQSTPAAGIGPDTDHTGPGKMLEPKCFGFFFSRKKTFKSLHMAQIPEAYYDFCCPLHIQKAL